MRSGKNRKTVLITGAGAGIGREMARLFYRAGYFLLAVSLVKEELESLESELDFIGEGNNSEFLSMDLARPGAAGEVFAWCDSRGYNVDVLINNAGFGLMGEVVELPSERLTQMLYLNIMTVTELSRLFGGTMKKRGSGHILNVASTISFQPLPYLAMYSATKAYVSYFTQSLAAELRPCGVIVSCLYPGTTRTAFLDTAGIHRPHKGITAGTMIHAAAMDPVKVARAAFKGILRGRRRIIPGLSNRFHFYFIHWVPNRLIIFVVRIVLKGLVKKTINDGAAGSYRRETTPG
ncbi:MAG: short-chain dehydrogenase [Spirochaetae bacterium HGW-Spirochaetae-1]|jgi:hypothetical protein|nr:MAG: short-chain dehydrogenase [Spirochaetae bacterium HGW-Spirochaetae-1]